MKRRLFGWVLLVIAAMSVSVSSFEKLWSIYLDESAPTYKYLVKLKFHPMFGVGVGEYQSADSVFLYDFDYLIADNKAHVELLYPDKALTDLDKYVVVTTKHDIESSLIADSYDVEYVEDGASLLSNDQDDENYYNDGYYNNDPVTYDVKNDKTWGLRLPKVAEALKVLKPTREVLVAVVDTGCDLTHPFLKERLVKGHNFAGGDPEDASNRNRNESHATHVSGTIIAAPDTDGFYGIAYKVAKVMPVRVLNESGSGTLISVCRGIVYASDNKANVINMSLGTSQYSAALADACKYADDKKVTVVCAKGNNNSSSPNYPSDLPNIIRVAATALQSDGSEKRAYFSNYGANCTCSAPGHFIYSTLPGGSYGFYSGTSMACPHAAACAALILCQGDFTPEQVSFNMETRGDILQTDKPIGKRINCLNCVEKTKHDTMPPNELSYRYNDEGNNEPIKEPAKTPPVDDRIFDSDSRHEDKDSYWYSNPSRNRSKFLPLD